jgi:hypothetical protein
VIGESSNETKEIEILKREKQARMYPCADFLFLRYVIEDSRSFFLLFSPFSKS